MLCPPEAPLPLWQGCYKWWSGDVTEATFLNEKVARLISYRGADLRPTNSQEFGLFILGDIQFSETLLSQLPHSCLLHWTAASGTAQLPREIRPWRGLHPTEHEAREGLGLRIRGDSTEFFEKRRQIALEAAHAGGLLAALRRTPSPFALVRAGARATHRVAPRRDGLRRSCDPQERREDLQAAPGALDRDGRYQERVNTIGAGVPRDEEAVEAGSCSCRGYLFWEGRDRFFAIGRSPWERPWRTRGQAVREPAVSARGSAAPSPRGSLRGSG